MSNSSQIISNFKTYNNFLSTLENEDKRIATSLKMMYSIHMENVQADKNKLFVIKQLLRFMGKLIAIPFYTISIKGLQNHSSVAILENTKIANDISSRMDISLIKMSKTLNINLRTSMVYKKLFIIINLSFKNKTLNKQYLLSLLHRYIDYLMVYETLNIAELELLLMENDRLPQNLALIHLLRDAKKVTIKYDNWLIDPINHNDIYCDYYFYPSTYHKKIIEFFSYNKNLKYIKGGFLDWDKLSHYDDMSNNEILSIVYFTQFGISKAEHNRYVSDIVEILELLKFEYTLTIKVHPREKIADYIEFQEISSYIKIINISEDIYALISKSNYCFSVFSTISLEAKHIIDNSYFINYDSDDFTIVDYGKVNLDLIKNKDMLIDVLVKKHTPVSKEKFLENNNCTFPNTSRDLQRFIDGFKI